MHNKTFAASRAGGHDKPRERKREDDADPSEDTPTL